MTSWVKLQSCISFNLHFVHRLILCLACDIMVQCVMWGRKEQLDFSVLNLYYVSVLFMCLWMCKMSKDSLTSRSSWHYINLKWKNVHFLFLSYLDVVLYLWGMMFLLPQRTVKCRRRIFWGMIPLYDCDPEMLGLEKITEEHLSGKFKWCTLNYFITTFLHPLNCLHGLAVEQWGLSGYRQTKAQTGDQGVLDPSSSGLTSTSQALKQHGRTVFAD